MAASPDCNDTCPNESALVDPSEPGTELTCDDSVDNDCDGLTDAADGDCAPAGCPHTCGDIDGSGGNVTLVDFASFAVCFGQSTFGRRLHVCRTADDNDASGVRGV